MDEISSHRSSKPAGDPSVVVFLGLYLLLLAFFILLNTISQPSEEKVASAVESVGKAFHEIMPPALRSESDLVAQGAVIATDTFEGEMKAALASIIAVAEVETLGGNLLRMDTTVEDLFDAGGEVPLRKTLVFFDRIGRVFGRTEAGMRREMEIIIGVGKKLPNSVDAGSSLELRQMTLMIDEFSKRKVPGRLMSIGLSPGDEGNIVMFFNSRPEEDDEADGTSQ